MNQLTKYEDLSLDDIQRTAKLMVYSGYFEVSKDMTVAIAQIATKILAGRELGIPPFAAVQGIDLIKGKPVMKPVLMASLIKAHPKYDYEVAEMSDERVSIVFYEGSRELGTSTFTLQDAQRAESGRLVAPGAKKDMLARFPRNMLWVRAMSNGVRWYMPDVMAGSSVYASGELDEDDRLPDDIPFEDNPFDSSPEGEERYLTAVASAVQSEELSMSELVNSWKGPHDAKQWAKDIGACGHPEHCNNAWLKAVRACGGYGPESKRDVFIWFYNDRMESLQLKAKEAQGG